jgi:hypothetical protein
MRRRLRRCRHLLMGLAVAVQRSFHLLARRVEDMENT